MQFCMVKFSFVPKKSRVCAAIAWLEEERQFSMKFEMELKGFDEY